MEDEDRGDEPTERRRRRRWPWATVGTVVVLALLAAAWWFLWVPAWRPPLTAGERYGIDVSTHQGTIAWARVADDGIRFAYIKATEGADHVDDRFAENWDGAGAASLDRGAYHFFTLCTPGADQSRQLPGRGPARSPLRSLLLVDLELAGNCSRRPDPATVDHELTSLPVGGRSRPGVGSVVLYVGDDFEGRYPRAGPARPTAVAPTLPRPARRPAWTIWQAQGYASVDGISGDVDLDVMR